MNKKDVDLFYRATHDIKTLIAEVQGERKKYHTKLEELKNQHDEELSGLISQLMSVLDELNELIEDLIAEPKYCEICKKELGEDDKGERCVEHSNYKIFKGVK